MQKKKVMMKNLHDPRRFIVSAVWLVLGTMLAAPQNASAQVSESARLDISQAIEAALTNNPGYQRIGLDTDIAELELKKAEAAGLPTLDLSGSYTHYSDPMTISPIHEAGVFPSLDRDILTNGLYAQMPLFTGGRLSATKDLARAQFDSSEQLAESLKQDLILSVTRTYSDLLTLEKLREASDERLDFFRAEADRIDLLLSLGRATDLDRAKILTGFERARYDRVQLDAAYEKSLTFLASLMSADTPNSLILSDFKIPQASLPATLAAATDIAHEEHPALREAASDLGAAESRISIAKSAKRPQVSAVGNARAMSGGNFNPQEEWQIGVRITVPIFDGGIKSRDIQQARMEKKKARLAFDNLVNQTNAAIRNAWQTVDALRRGIVVSQAALKQAEEALRIEKLRYENSRSTVNDLTSAEAALWEAKSNLARSENSYELGKAELLRTMGVLEARNMTPSMSQEKKDRAH